MSKRNQSKQIYDPKDKLQSSHSLNMIKAEPSNDSTDAPLGMSNSLDNPNEQSNSELHDDKKIGVTHAIRQRLNFTDERLWKRFSARRLEMIDTMDLLSKKASEQEDEIKQVADSLRKEFEYSEEYFGDFDKLVRAAVQSVRRNRKRSSNSRRKDKGGNVKSEKDHLYDTGGYKRQKTGSNGAYTSTPETTGTISGDEMPPASTYVAPSSLLEKNLSDFGQGSSFVSEIAHINTDGNNAIFDLNYSKSKHFSPQDRSRAIMDSMIKPRVGGVPPFIPANSARTPTATNSHANSDSVPTVSQLPLTNNGSSQLGSSLASQITRVGHLLPPLANVRINSELPEPRPIPTNSGGLLTTRGGTGISQTSSLNIKAPTVDVSGARRTLQRYMEASKSCSEDRGDNTNTRTLGKACLESGIAYLFAHLFEHVDGSLIEYLRGKLTLVASCEKLLKSMDPLILSTMGKQETETVFLTLHGIIGCCVKDFGFDKILLPLCELIYGLVIEDYTAILKNSVPFKATEQLEIKKEIAVGNVLDSHEGIRSVSSMSGTSNMSDVSNAAAVVIKKEARGESGLNSLAAIATEQMKLEVNGGNRYAFGTNANGSNSGTIAQPMHMSRSTSPLMHSIVTEHGDKKVGISTPFGGVNGGYGPFLPKKKKVILRFLNRVIELEFPMKNAAPPRLGELIENARTAFNLNYMMSTDMWGVRKSDGQIITSDLELEKLFFTENFQRIELEIFNQGSRTIPIYEITSTISSNPTPPAAPSPGAIRKDELYILPPPVASHNLHLYPNAAYGSHQPPALRPLGPTSGAGATFIGDDRGKPPRPQPMLPRFQRLL